MEMHNNMDNLEIAELLRSVAAVYQIENKEANRFRIIAYERAADAIEHASSELKDLWDEGKLNSISGIGPSIAMHLDEIFKNGFSKHFKMLFKGFPPQVFELLKISGVGPKTAIKLVSELKLNKDNPVKDLKKYCEIGKVAKLEGFGEDSQKEILVSINEIQNRPKRHLLNYAESIANEIVSWIKEDKNVSRVDVLGSLRRRASTIGDIDIAAISISPEDTLMHFSEYPKKSRLIEIGKKTSSIMLPGGVQVDLMVQDGKSYGSLLQHFTGSKHHNIALREHALKMGLSLSEYGIKKLDSENKIVKKYKDEESFYKALGMAWIPPELREDNGEIEAALQNKIPKLIETPDVIADLQIHSSFDVETSHDLGESTIEEIASKAIKLGYEYVALTDHNPSISGHTDKEIVDIIKRRKDAIEQYNYSQRDTVSDRVVHVFNSLEIDILSDGNLAFPENGLDSLDFALASIHSGFRQDKNTATKRVLRALTHPKIKIFAHPTGRKLNEREGIELNWEEIFDFCVKNNKWIEINADPMRLDLPDFLVKEAVKRNVKLTFGTDSHNLNMMDNMKFAVSVARRGWVTRDNIVNCLPLEVFKKLLQNG